MEVVDGERQSQLIEIGFGTWKGLRGRGMGGAREVTGKAFSFRFSLFSVYTLKKKRKKKGKRVILRTRRVNPTQHDY
jgi:hypothetical protein